MKKINTKIGYCLAVAALLFLNSVPAFSQAKNVQLNLSKLGATIAEIKIDNINLDEPALITIKNENGITLFSEKSEANRYVQLVDFAPISDGIYLVDIAQSKSVVRKLIKKENHALTIQDESYVFNNYIKFPEERKLLVKFNNQIKEPVTLRIFDEKGNILHEEADIRTENYIALFNLSKLNSGSYNMSLTSDAFTKTQKIQL